MICKHNGKLITTRLYPELLKIATSLIIEKFMFHCQGNNRYQLIQMNFQLFIRLLKYGVIISPLR